MVKTLFVQNEQFEAEKVIKTHDSVIGYIGDAEVFAFRNVSDFTLFSLGDNQSWDQPEPTESQLLGQMYTDLELASIEQGQQITDLELKILTMEVK